MESFKILVVDLFVGFFTVFRSRFVLTVSVRYLEGFGFRVKLVTLIIKHRL